MNLLKQIVLPLVLMTAPLVQADDAAMPAPEGAGAYIIEPVDGATVPETFVVRFGLRGMGVAPAGVEREGTGHHHLMINGEAMPMMGRTMGDEVKHFGGGQTEVELTLPKGQHRLQLILGDHRHMPHHPAVMSEPITITVE